MLNAVKYDICSSIQLNLQRPFRMKLHFCNRCRSLVVIYTVHVYIDIFSVSILFSVFWLLLEVLMKRDNVKQHVTEEMLDEIVEICLSETDTISLLDIPSTFVSEDTNDAEAIK